MENHTQLNLTFIIQSDDNTRGIVTDPKAPTRPSPRRQIDRYIESLARIARDRSDDGRPVSLITVMFNRVSQDTRLIPSLVHEPVQRLYAKLCTRVVRRPRAPSAVDRLPVLLGCADLPIFKHRATKASPHDPNVSGGLHYHGLLAIPAGSRLEQQSIQDHFALNRNLYCAGGISHIDLRPVRDQDLAKVVRYVFKAVTDGLIDLDAGVLILPRASSELG